MKINNLKFYSQDGHVIVKANKGEIPDVVICKKVYGANFAACPKCGDILGGYYDFKLRKYNTCPYCGCWIGWKE